MYGLRHKGLAKKRPSPATSGSSKRINADGSIACSQRPTRVTSQRTIADGGSANSQRTIADGGSANSQRPTSGNSHGTNTDVGTINSQRVADEQINTQMNTGDCLDSNDGASGSLLVRDEPPKKPRGRGKRNVTEFRVPPPDERVMLKPKGNRQFSYVGYNPRDYKIGSQVGALIKRLYPGMVNVRDEEGNVVDTRAAMSWYDYYCKKDGTGVTYATLVKREFWRVFKVSRADVRHANRNLDEYLRKRVSDLIYQARLDAVKFHAKCDDNQARNLQLTEEEYINCKLPWCAQDAWCYLSKYWVSESYMEKRKIAQASRLKSTDVAQNRGGSRPFAETQQLLEYKFGPSKATTVNTYAVMKSGFKKVDDTGKSAPIPSRKARKRLATYCTSTQLPENSKDLDVHALYVMENGMAHGRVPIGDGCVDKQALAATAKSHRSSSSTIAYQNMVDEYDQLKERNEALERANKKLNENNEILIEESVVNRELMMSIFEDLNKQPRADLMDRLANLEARRHQVSQASHVATHPLEMLSDANDLVTDDDDYDYNEMDDSNSYESYDDFDEDDDCNDLRGGEDDDISSSHEEEDGSDNNGADVEEVDGSDNNGADVEEEDGSDDNEADISDN